MAYKEAIRHVMGINLEYSDKKRITRIELMKILPECSQTQLSEIISYKEDVYAKYHDLTVLNTNLFKLLAFLHSSYHETLLLTESRRCRAVALCEYHGLMRYFSQCYFLEDYEGKNKYYFLSEIGINPIDCILFENDDNLNQIASCTIPKSNIIQIKL